MLVLSRRTDESIVIELADGMYGSMTLAELFADGPILITLLVEAAVASRWESKLPISFQSGAKTSPKTPCETDSNHTANGRQYPKKAIDASTKS